MIPELNAWNDYEETVDEQAFTPHAEKGWLAHNGYSPEVAVCDFVSILVKMMQPKIVVETGVGQGYTTRAIAAALEGTGGHLFAFESDDRWRETTMSKQFWIERKTVATLSQHATPPLELFVACDLCILDSDWDLRFAEIEWWNEYAKPGAAAFIHDTADRDETIHQTLRKLITDLGMTGVFLNNPRGSFMAVQPQRSE